MSKSFSDSTLLGEFKHEQTIFPNLEQIFAEFELPQFKELPARKRFHRVNQLLLESILNSPNESFLLPAIIAFIRKVNDNQLLDEDLSLSSFEFWLNQFSELNESDNYRVRAKISGKFIPREDYQALFPIGMNKTFNGSHFVAAHLSPDVDTMIASFWGWVDAFAARVGDARHLWSLPGGPPNSQVTNFLLELFGDTFFHNVANSSGSLTLSAIDLVTQKGFLKRKGQASTSSVELSMGEKAVVLIDESGHFIGDWHQKDVDAVRQIIIGFKSCLRWFENNLHVKLISLFANKKLNVKDIPPFLSSIFDVSLKHCEPTTEFSDQQKKDLNSFFLNVLGMEKGIQSTFRELNLALAKLSIPDLLSFQHEVESLEQSELFDAEGNLIEDRPAIFNWLVRIIHTLDHAVHRVRDYGEQLDVAINIKSKVLKIPTQFVTMRSDVEDIRIKMQQQEYLTVVIPEREKLFPIGVVWSYQFQKPILGTVSFRDFCNQEEVRMAAYLTPISVMDHHKSSLKTNSPPLAIIGDTQSCNVLLAEQAFLINDRYSLGGMSSAQIQAQYQKLLQGPTTATNSRLIQRLLMKRIAADVHDDYFIHPKRELTEYFCFLHAILDDTDLLTKVSRRDIDCVIQLLNRIKSLIVKEEVEIIHLDDLPKNGDFVKAAAKRILKNPEMFSFYRGIYENKEKEVENNLKGTDTQHYEALFVDTKVQNGCCRVGQTKLFSINFPVYLKHANKLMEYWHQTAVALNHEQPEIDLFLHMISTIPSADEVYKDQVGHYKHQDELWFWIPDNPRAYDHLTSFLTAFQAGNKLNQNVSLEFYSGMSDEQKQIYLRNFPGVPWKHVEESNIGIAVLKFGAGLLNSRKAMISPYLPKIT